MKRTTQLIASLIKDENGGEVLEYAMVAALLVIVCVLAVNLVGTKVLAKWTQLGNSI